jgi:hypothetical protein
MNPAWLFMAVLQTAAILIAAAVVWRRRERMRLLGRMLLGIGVLIIVVNVLWLATGGLTGESPIIMRGGMPGFWLSNLTAVEIMALALFALRIRRRRSVV